MRIFLGFCSILAALFLTVTALATLPLGQVNNFDRVLEELIRDKLSDNTLSLDISLESKDKMQSLRDNVDNIDHMQLTSFSPAHSSFRLQVAMKDGNTTELSGRYTAFLEMPVPSKIIYSGDIISEADMTTTPVKINKIKPGLVTSIQGVLGMQAKKNLPIGMQIRETDVTKPYVIHDRDMVTILYQNDNLTLKASGIATQPGAIGDVIKVKNSSTNTIVYGQVKSSTIVQVDPES